MTARALRLALAVSLLFVSCSRKENHGTGTVAVLPFENLSGNADLDWMGRGFAEALRLQLAGTPGREVVAVPTLRDVPSTRANRVIQGYFSVPDGRLTFHAGVEDVQTHRIPVNLTAAGALGSGVLPLAQTVARAIDPNCRPLPTTNAAAFRAYILGLEAPDPAAASTQYQQAAAADPGFGAVYLAWAQTLAASGDKKGAAGVLTTARANASRFPSLERDRLSLLAARLAGDTAGQRQALLALAQAEPKDSSTYRALAELDTAAHSYTSAAKWYMQVLAYEPGDIAALNQIGYVLSWAGDLDGAIKALSRYRDMRPQEANPLDSIGDAYYYLGRFADAEKAYLAAFAKQPQFLAGGELYKAAWARLMQGDMAGAEAHHAKFLAARQAAHDIVPYRAAQWEYVTGRRKQAIARLEEFARTAPPAPASLAWSQLAVWSLESGDRNRAREYARRAPGPTQLTVLCGFLTAPEADAAEWTARADRAFPQPGQAAIRQAALGYALLLSKQFRPAVQVLSQVYDRTTPSTADWPAIPLAWALEEIGHFERVPELVEHTAAPESTGEHLFLSLTFPRLYSVRAALAEKQNRPEDAKRNSELFVRYAGEGVKAVAQL